MECLTAAMTGSGLDRADKLFQGGGKPRAREPAKGRKIVKGSLKGEKVTASAAFWPSGMLHQVQAQSVRSDNHCYANTTLPAPVPNRAPFPVSHGENRSKAGQKALLSGAVTDPHVDVAHDRSETTTPSLESKNHALKIFRNFQERWQALAPLSEAKIGGSAAAKSNKTGTFDNGDSEPGLDGISQSVRGALLRRDIKATQDLIDAVRQNQVQLVQDLAMVTHEQRQALREALDRVDALEAQAKKFSALKEGTLRDLQNESQDDQAHKPSLWQRKELEEVVAASVEERMAVMEKRITENLRPRRVKSKRARSRANQKIHRRMSFDSQKEPETKRLSRNEFRDDCCKRNKSRIMTNDSFSDSDSEDSDANSDDHGDDDQTLLAPGNELESEYSVFEMDNFMREDSDGKLDGKNVEHQGTLKRSAVSPVQVRSAEPTSSQFTVNSEETTVPSRYSKSSQDASQQSSRSIF